MTLGHRCPVEVALGNQSQALACSHLALFPFVRIKFHPIILTFDED